MQKEIGKTVIKLIKGDITEEICDAIVNAANSSLMGGGGVDGAIHRAGGAAILEECKKIVAKQGRLPTGEAVITTAGNLKCKYVIHTVGPVWCGGTKGEPELLKNAYVNSLKLAVSYNLESIAFPSISTGTYGYPIDNASVVAIGSVMDFIKNQKHSLKEVRFVLFSDKDYFCYKAVLDELV